MRISRLRTIWYRIVAAAVATAVPVVVVISTLAMPAAAQTSGFGDVPDDVYFTTPVADLHAAGVFNDTLCDEGFCPGVPIDRKTMAVWTIRVLDGQDPPAITQSRFDDVDSASYHAPFIERMAELEVTRGCGDPSRFCPDRNVTRAEMAAFLTRAFSLPDGPDPGFGDVAVDAWYATDVAALAASGITTGCGEAAFCPGHDTTRAQMATFLHRAVRWAADADDDTQIADPVADDDTQIADAVADAEAYMVELVNELRESLDIPPLEHHEGIAVVARRWSNTMQERNDFRHNPNYVSEYPPGSTLRGENIGRLSVFSPESLRFETRQAFEGLRNSPGHYANMIHRGFGQIGVGIALGQGQFWVTQNFACYPPDPAASICGDSSEDQQGETAPVAVRPPDPVDATELELPWHG